MNELKRIHAAESIHALDDAIGLFMEDSSAPAPDWLADHKPLTADLRAMAATGSPRKADRALALKVVFIDGGGAGTGRLGELVMEQVTSADATGELYPAHAMAGVLTDAAWDGEWMAASRYAGECSFGIAKGTDVRWSVRVLPAGSNWDMDAKSLCPLRAGQQIIGRSAGIAFFLGLFALAQAKDEHGEWHAKKVVEKLVSLATLPADVSNGRNLENPLETLGGQELEKLAALAALPLNARIAVIFPVNYSLGSPNKLEQIQVATIAKLAELLRNKCDDINFAKQRKVHARHRRKSIVFGFLALLIVLFAVWWIKNQIGSDIQRLGKKTDSGIQNVAAAQEKILAEQKFDAPRVRAELMVDADRQRDADFADAEKADSSEERQRRRESAREAYRRRIENNDDIVARLAEMYGRTNTTAFNPEFKRSLQEGVDAALTYVQREKGNILAEVRSALEAERRRTRPKLIPLLEAANLQASKGQTAAARANYRELLALDPGWSEVLDAFGWFLHGQSIQSQREDLHTTAIADAEEAHALATRLHDADGARTSAQRLIGFTHGRISEVLFIRRQPGDEDKAFAHLTRSLELLEKLLAANPGSTQAVRDVSFVLVSLGTFLAVRGQPGDAEKAFAHLTRSLELREKLLAANPASTEAQRDASFSLANLGHFHAGRWQVGNADKALAHFTRSLELLEKLLAANPGSADAQRDASFSLANLGHFLDGRWQVGNADKALAHFTRSLELLEKLLAANPGSAEAQRNASLSLANLGHFLDGRVQPGDAEKALTHFTRSLELLEKLLAASPGSALEERNVSFDLIILGHLLDERAQPGDAENALAHFIRSLELREKLLTASPGSAFEQRDVTVSLDNLGDFLAERAQPGDAEKALAHYTRSLELREKLLAASPDSTFEQRNVTVSLDNLGDFLAERAQPDDAEKALAHYTRSLELREKLLTANPGSAFEQRNVTVSLDNLGDFLAERSQPGDAEKALAHYTRSLELREKLLAANPGSAVEQDNARVSLNNLGRFFDQHPQPADTDKAFAHFTRSLEFNEKLLAANPGSAKVQNDVADGLLYLNYFLQFSGQPVKRTTIETTTNLNYFLSWSGQPDDTDKAFEKKVVAHFTRGLELHEKLLAVNSDSSKAQRGLAWSFINFGNFLAFRRQPGDLEKALAHFTRSLELREKRLAANPTSTNALVDVSSSLNALGHFFDELAQPSDTNKALAHYTRSLELREKLLAANPGWAAAQSDVAVSLQNVAAILDKRGQTGDADKALTHFTRNLELREKILAANPTSAEAQRYVAVSLQNVAAILDKRGQTGDANKALTHFTRSLELCEKLLAANHGSAEAQRDVAVSLQYVGLTLKKRGQTGDADKALTHFTRSLELHEKLLAANSNSVSDVHNLAMTHSQLAIYAAKHWDLKRANRHLRAGYDLLKRSIEQGMKFDPSVVEWYESLKAKFGSKKP